MEDRDIKFDFFGDLHLSSKHVKKVIDEQIAEYETELQKIKNDVFHLVGSGNCPLARDKAESAAPFQTAIATLKQLKTKLGLDKE